MKKDWGIKKLGDIGNVFNGNSINERVKKSKYLNIAEGLAYIATKDISYDNVIDYGNGVKIPFTEKNSFKIVPKCSVLICAEGGSAGRKIGYTDKTICFGNKLFALVTKDNVNSRFVYYWYFSLPFQKNFHNYLSGIIGGVSLSKFKEIEIPLPPLPEQKRIVAILDEVFEGVGKAKENAEKNLQNARELFESYLQSAFANPGDGWEEKRLGEVCEKITKGSSPNWQGIRYVDKPGVLFITSENVGENKIILGKRKYVEERFNISDKKSILQNGDVLTNIVGASIGRTAVFTLNQIANINQAVCILRCNSGILYNLYLMHLLNSPFFKKVLHDNEVDNARANLSLGFFSNLLIPLPPLPVQRSIVAKLDALSVETKKLESIYRQKLADLDELRKSILQKAFNGELAGA